MRQPLGLDLLRFPRIVQQAKVAPTPRYRSCEWASHRTRTMPALEPQWYCQLGFQLHDGVSPRLVLQVALLLVGCTISKYLWDAYSTGMPVILAVVPFVVVFYLFVDAARTAPTNHPDQTPTSTIPCSAGPPNSSPFRI